MGKFTNFLVLFQIITLFIAASHQGILGMFKGPEPTLSDLASPLKIFFESGEKITSANVKKLATIIEKTVNFMFENCIKEDVSPENANDCIYFVRFLYYVYPLVHGNVSIKNYDQLTGSKLLNPENVFALLFTELISSEETMIVQDVLRYSCCQTFFDIALRLYFVKILEFIALRMSREFYTDNPTYAMETKKIARRSHNEFVQFFECFKILELLDEVEKLDLSYNGMQKLNEAIRSLTANDTEIKHKEYIIAIYVGRLAGQCMSLKIDVNISPEKLKIADTKILFAIIYYQILPTIHGKEMSKPIFFWYVVYGAAGINQVEELLDWFTIIKLLSALEPIIQSIDFNYSFNSDTKYDYSLVVLFLRTLLKMKFIKTVLASNEYINLLYVIMNVRRTLIAAGIFASRTLPKSLVDPTPFPWKSFGTANSDYFKKSDEYMMNMQYNPIPIEKQCTKVLTMEGALREKEISNLKMTQPEFNGMMKWFGHISHKSGNEAIKKWSKDQRIAFTLKFSTCSDVFNKSLTELYGESSADIWKRLDEEGNPIKPQEYTKVRIKVTPEMLEKFYQTEANSIQKSSIHLLPPEVRQAAYKLVMDEITKTIADIDQNKLTLPQIEIRLKKFFRIVLLGLLPFTDDDLWKLMKGILIRFMISVSGLPDDTFDLIRKFIKIYLSKIDHYDKLWYDERVGSMVKMHGDLLGNIEKLWKLSKTNGMKQAMEILVLLSSIIFYNYQEELRKSLVKGKNANSNTQEYVIQLSNMQNLVKFLQNFGSNDENFPVTLERFFNKSDGIKDGIRKMLNDEKSIKDIPNLVQNPVNPTDKKVVENLFVFLVMCYNHRDITTQKTNDGKVQITVANRKHDSTATNNLKRMLEIWKSMAINSDSEIVRKSKTTFLATNLQAFAHINLGSSKQDQKIVSKRFMECLSNEVSSGDFVTSTYIAISTLSKFGPRTTPDTPNSHDEYTKELSVGQGYFKDIYGAHKDVNPYKNDSVEGFITGQNARIISENIGVH